MKNANLKIVNKKKMRLSLSELYAKISIHGVEKIIVKLQQHTAVIIHFFTLKK